MFQRDANGISGGGTFRFGESSVTIGGRLARSDIRRLRQFLEQAQRYYETSGYPAEVFPGGCTGPFGGYSPPQLTGDFLSDLAQGTSIARDIANSPIGGAIAAYTGPYGAAAIAAANGLAAGVDALKAAGISPQHAQTVAQLTHPDPRARAQAESRVKNINDAAQKGDQRAKAIKLGLQQAMGKHLAQKLRETEAALAAAQQRLAELGDPMAYAGAGMPQPQPSFPAQGYLPPGGMGYGYGYTSGPGAVPPELSAVLGRAVQQARFAPQPTFRRYRARA